MTAPGTFLPHNVIAQYVSHLNGLVTSERPAQELAGEVGDAGATAVLISHLFHQFGNSNKRTRQPHFCRLACSFAQKYGYHSTFCFNLSFQLVRYQVLYVMALSVDYVNIFLRQLVLLFFCPEHLLHNRVLLGD